MAQNFYVHTDDFFIEKYTLKRPQNDMHYHHSYEVYYVLEGEREYFVGDRFFKVGKSDLVWVPKDMLHRTDGKGATRILMFFNDEFLSKYYREELLHYIVKSEPFVFHADSKNDELLHTYFKQLLAEYEAQTAPDGVRNELVLAGYLFQILFLLQSADNTYVPPDTGDRRISDIVKYINENYMHISSIEEIAERFFISKYYLCHIFRESLGVPFITYLNTIRIRAACEMIKSSDYKLTEIATKSGFNSLPYFCKVFKDEKGVTPTAYRKKVSRK